MNFDELVDRHGTFSVKWDEMETIYGVPKEDGLSMWVADSDFKIADVIADRLHEAVNEGILGYIDAEAPYRDAIQWWMKTRHGWDLDTDSIFTTTGLVNGVGMCLDTFTQPGDGVVVFAPVYHAFAKVIRNAGREVVECEMVNSDGLYTLDFDAYDAQMTGKESMLILCSPHNPGGRVWTQEELRGVADFAKRHNLMLLSDEIHQDLVFDGHRHIPMPVATPDVIDRLMVLSAPSKTFNIAGLHTGQVIIPDPDLRARFKARMLALSLASNSLGQYATTTAYSPEGAAWADAQLAYLDGNRQVFDAAMAEIPGLSSMNLQSTYLAWVDFTDTGMERAEFTERVEQGAKIAANYGTSFGTGGENFLRFNLATPRSRVEEACARLKAAFGDLQ
ncbi:pyridoxal phosphate-dependent aminotransferase [Epibacterium ulvae]|uniref:MalY/PatB family protein n=1 Tax=Epibacterium ulvae TaxID=1156985 RepID=UPI001BFC600E|nr:MalY/PatB family protein [Epibacterium ulvae]MBT8153364.1 pyridoxal phosphate-dependent aminotransferase [Epibacterium ulvae]